MEIEQTVIGFGILTGATFSPNLFESREKAEQHLAFWTLGARDSLIVEVVMTEADAAKWHALTDEWR